jgi:tRNA pseudouridine38-40 synthase
VTQWKLTLSYDGTGFHGWQVQPGLVTIQGTLSAAISAVIGETVLPQGSGRTDSGVHALAQVVSFALEAPIPPANLLRALNAALPSSIRVTAAEVAPLDFHARHSAVRKSYEYRLFERTNLSHNEIARNICPPFLAPYVWDCRWPLDFDRLHQAASYLTGQHDFASFASSDPDRTNRENDAIAFNSTRTIFTSSWSRERDWLAYRISGSGFLHHMVRNIVGTFVDLGRGALEPADIPRILAARDRTAAGPTAPARGLFLISVDYPEPTTEAAL